MSTDIGFTEPVFTIGIVAKLLNISPESIRLYERQHLILPYKTKTDRRLFSKMDIEWIQCFRQYINRNLLKIKDIIHYLAQFPCYETQRCSGSTKKQCLVYNNPNQICWASINCPNRKPERIYCRECEVYKHICTLKSLPFKNTAQPTHIN